MTSPGSILQLDIDKARELVDGYAPASAPYRDLGEPSWFTNDAERRHYWHEHSVEVVRWAREYGFASPRAAIRYGLPGAARTAMWEWGR